jgi:hypothetical protein
MAQNNSPTGDSSMSQFRRLTVASVAGIFFLCAASPSYAIDPPKQPAKTQPAKTEAAPIRPAPIQPVTALRQAQAIKAQDPAGPGNTNSFKPNERMKTGASAGWDSKASDTGAVRIGNSNKVDLKALNKQHDAEALGIAHRYPAIGKAPPVPTSSPAPEKPASGPRNFFNKLFGK